MTLADQAARDMIATDLGCSLFVEAGAGSGKTTVLVRRIVALVTAGLPLPAIAAVTFTEKAAAELRDRVRVGLEEAGQTRALDDLDGAAIGTLHSFARRILTEHPIEAGLPPLIDVLDEVGSRVAADRRWEDLQTRLLQDPAVAPVLRLGLAAGLTLDHLHTLAQQLDANWDLVEERIATTNSLEPPRLNLTALRTRIATVTDCRGDCRDPGDKLLAQIHKLDQWLSDTGGADPADLLGLLTTLPGPGNGGRAANWGGRPVVDGIKDEIKNIKADGAALRGHAIDRILRCLLPAIAADTLRAARQRAAAGRLQFHDLLVLARRLVRQSVPARTQLSRRYRRLLLDEAQDTDPIQIELAVRIAAGQTATAHDWRHVAVPAGALFFVGDSKQSIYRFRRADIRTYLDARNTLGAPVSLTTNFRATTALLGWINRVFARLITETPGAQPAYEALQPGSDDGHVRGPHVVVLGDDEHADGPSAEVVRTREAHDVAGLVVRAVREGWQVRGRAGEPRPLSLSDITILAPTRTSISGLEQALDQVAVSYRTEAATFVYSAPEVRELMLCVTAVDDPTDELAVVSTLRTPMFGCSDADLWRWKQARGSWNLFAPPVHDGVVADGLAQLRRWARLRSRWSPSKLLEDVLDRGRVLEAAVDSPHYRETWRRLRFVVDQARAWSEAEHGSLREYLRWAAGQAADSARVSETVLPETDADAVRITTIHASKGLEFPFVIVAGLSSPGAKTRPPVLWPADGGCEVKLGADLETLGYRDADAAEKTIEDCEDIRLLYVACTRAKDHLAVSLHRGGRACPAAVLAAACRGAGHENWAAPDVLEPLDRRVRPAAAPLPGWPEWTSNREVALANSRRREAESATDIAHGRASSPLPTFAHHGLAKQPRDLELPAWAKGRYGTAIGRAVHAVLQTVDLTTGDGLDELAASQALTEGVADAAPDIATAVRAALDSPTVTRAATKPHWRETYVGTIVDNVQVEGYVDLLYRDDDGLVLVDYKTDTAMSADALAAYEIQLRVYARAIEDASTERVVRSVLLFLRPTGALEHVIMHPAARPRP
ncbi:UvrD-helicase domain-containing protein [Amycolatopsis sp. NPDC051128]|uniref:UvrD-helicase domain-containing protein n=1 Tax=Amycolatopsis sp. NPDC051128 TaxID=3155412 RepID=UPI003424D60D